VLHEPRFADLDPAEVYAMLLDAGQYLCSERTMYRVLAAHQEVRERRQQLRHLRYAAPELLANVGRLGCFPSGARKPSRAPLPMWSTIGPRLVSGEHLTTMWTSNHPIEWCAVR
jgi:hypothetical protein